MIKRLVILQDEQLVIRELRVLAARAPQAQFATAGAVSADHAAYPVSAPPPPVPPLIPEPVEEAPSGSAPASAPGAGQEGRTLADVARAAAVKAERAAIEQTLDQVRWNRRKAAQLLGVSYKTLLNKIKECGISQK
jgi:DNA-binding NtrC family response regulator